VLRAQLVALYQQPAFIGYLIVVGSAIVGLLLYNRYASRLKSTYGPWSKQYNRIHRSHVFALPTLAGVLGAQTIWIAKVRQGARSPARCADPCVLLARSRWRRW